MKKTILYVGAALAMVFSLNSCNKEIVDLEEGNVVKQGIPFAIVANPVETRTENDGMSTKWVADDAINVFHAVAGTTTYVSDGDFTIASADLESNVFRGTLSETLVEGTSYDWYMFYPYTSQMVTPGEKTKGYVTVGSSASGTQTQSGNNSMEHLAGYNIPLLGKIANVSSTAMPSVSVNQACAFLEINVTNHSGSGLTVSQVIFTGTEPIVGTYYIDFAGQNVSFTGSGDTYVSDKAKLTVSGGSAIANGGSAKFYLAIKPFSAPSNGKLKISVNGYEKEITLSSAVTFSAGKIKKINFDYEPPVFTAEQFEHATSIAPGDRIIITSGILSTVSVMKHYESGNNCKAVGTTISNGIITTSEGMAVLTVGGAAGNYTFYDEVTEQYLNATGNNSNYLRASDDVDDYAKWGVTFSSNTAVIQNSGKTNYTIRYNDSDASNLLFSCYTKGQNAVYIFKKLKELSSITVSNAAPLEFFVGDTFSFTGTVTANFVDGSSEDVTSAAHFDYDLSTSGTKTVTVSYTKGSVTKTATYDITVNEKPEITMMYFNSDSWESAEKAVSNAQSSFSVGYVIANPIGTTTTAEVTIVNGSEWVTASNPTTSTSGVTQVFLVSANSATGGPRTAKIKLSYSNAPDVVFEVTQAAGDDYVQPTSKTVELTNANIVAAGNADTGYKSWTLTDENGNTWNAYAIKNKHSNATSSYHFLQIKKSDSSTAYYIKLPVLGTKIESITMTVSNTQKPMTDGGNSATLFFSSSNQTSASGNGVVSGTGTSKVTIDASSLNLNTGYITASGAVRVWDVQVTYSE